METLLPLLAEHPFWGCALMGWSVLVLSILCLTLTRVLEIVFVDRVEALYEPDNGEDEEEDDEVRVLYPVEDAYDGYEVVNGRGDD